MRLSGVASVDNPYGLLSLRVGGIVAVVDVCFHQRAIVASAWRLRLCRQIVVDMRAVTVDGAPPAPPPDIIEAEVFLSVHDLTPGFRSLKSSDKALQLFNSSRRSVHHSGDITCRVADLPRHPPQLVGVVNVLPDFMLLVLSGVVPQRLNRVSVIPANDGRRCHCRTRSLNRRRQNLDLALKVIPPNLKRGDV